MSGTILETMPLTNGAPDVGRALWLALVVVMRCVQMWTVTELSTEDVYLLLNSSHTSVSFNLPTPT